MSDKELQQAVEDQLAWEPAVNASHIGVAATNGVVTLSGHVPSYWEKVAAENAALRVKGVRAVVQEITIRLGEDRLADDEIAKRAVQALQSDASLPTDRVELKVEDGWVTMIGEVDWNYQRAAAERHVQRVAGVNGVTNRISIKSHVTVPAVREKISSALARTAAFDAQRIRIEVDGGKVTLRGEVETPDDRRTVEYAAWGTPGVTQVDNRIDVTW
jgi:osmotically-inducible protein OsmY